MKKIFIFIALAAFCGGLSLQASPVSPEKALDIAKKIFDAQKTTKSGSSAIKIIWNGEFEDDPVATKAVVQPAFYVVERDGGGWVMVAGDDNVRPVLGISTDGHFETDGMPDNVRWWMERIKAYVRSAKVQSQKVGEQWSMFIETKADNASIPDEYITCVVDRKTPDWKQGSPFNAKCPEINGQNCVTGCVALALGELLTYESGQGYPDFPTSATGTVQQYGLVLYPDPPYTGYVTPGHDYVLGAEYNWAGLRSLTDVSVVNVASSDLKNNLAQLLADLGAIVHAEYSLNDTGANSYGVIGYMIDHFGLNKSASMKHDYDFTPRQWSASLMAELDQRPVLFSGSTEEGYGHAFLLDGYGICKDGLVDDVFFRVNFGWGGFYNGYYCIDRIDDGVNGNWSYSCSAFFDFYPDANSVYPVSLEARYTNETYPGIRVEERTDYPGYFRFYYCIWNTGNSSYQGRIKFKVLRRDGTESDISNTTFDLSLNPSYYCTNWFGSRNINDIALGDRVVCYYQDGDEWKLLGGPAEFSISEWPLIPAAFIDSDASYSVGDYYLFRLKNYDHLYIGTTWRITDPDGVLVTLYQSDKEFQFTKPGKYKIEAAIAEDIDEEVTETVVAYITVGN